MVAKIRRNVAALFVISLIVQTGMWLERFIIVVTSLHRDFLPSSWGMYYPTELGLGDAIWFDRIVLHPVLAVHPIPAHDLDLRDARAGA